MIYTIITADIFAILVMMIILCGVHFEVRNRSIRSRIFELLVIVNVFACALDAASWILNGRAEHYNLLIFVNTMSFVIGYLECYVYVHFAVSHISRKCDNGKSVHIPFKRLLDIYVVVCSVVFTAAGFTGKLFSMEGGSYSETSVTTLYLITTILFFCYSFGVIYRYRRVLGTHDSVAMSTYLLFPLICIFINIFEPNLSLTYPSSALSFILLYVMLNHDNENSYILRDQFLMQVTRHDELTGLLNRRAFSDAYHGIESDIDIGVVFFDVNGLKYINDTYGHEAGDELLIKISGKLIENFRKEEIYRISGDEFVVLMPGISEKLMNVRLEKVRESLIEGEYQLAAIGSAYGPSVVLNEIAKIAENRMYEDKRVFYAKHPMFRRG